MQANFYFKWVDYVVFNAFKLVQAILVNNIYIKCLENYTKIVIPRTEKEKKYRRLLNIIRGVMELTTNTITVKRQYLSQTNKILIWVVLYEANDKYIL